MLIQIGRVGCYCCCLDWSRCVVVEFVKRSEMIQVVEIGIDTIDNEPSKASWNHVVRMSNARRCVCSVRSFAGNVLRSCCRLHFRICVAENT